MDRDKKRLRDGREATSHTRVRSPSVLLVDDFDDNREMYREYLEHCGYRVREARDGAEAVEMARAKHPPVIVMDLSLPVLDGWEATRILKSDPATSDIRIIALTGRAEASSRERAMAAGCDVFISKPCLPADVATAVKRCLDAVAEPVVSTPGRRPSRPR